MQVKNLYKVKPHHIIQMHVKLKFLYLPLNVTVCKMEERSPDLVSSMHAMVTVQRIPDSCKTIYQVLRL